MSKASRKLTSTKVRSVTLRTPSKELSLKVSGRAAAPAQLKAREMNGTLLVETERALRIPGLSRKAVFTGSSVSSYSVNPHNPRQYIKESKSGTKVVGRLVSGQFRPITIKSAANKSIAPKSVVTK